MRTKRSFICLNSFWMSVRLCASFERVRTARRPYRRKKAEKEEHDGTISYTGRRFPAMAVRDITRLLRRMQNEDAAGRRVTFDEVFELAYEEVKRLARAHMRRERADSLQPTAIVSETYLRLLGYGLSYNDSRHFLNMAARAMRRYLIDRARRANGPQRGGGRPPTTVREDDTAASILGTDPALLLDIDRAIETLHPDEQRLIELRFYCQFTCEEIARSWGVSEKTVGNRWRIASTKLRKRLKDWNERGLGAVG
jgi:RNA polymerase sigma factor (TIGR02999 family)